MLYLATLRAACVALKCLGHLGHPIGQAKQKHDPVKHLKNLSFLFQISITFYPHFPKVAPHVLCPEHFPPGPTF